jgi:hypothetical protein
LNYARRQQHRRLARTCRTALASLAAAFLGLLLVRIGIGLPGGLLLGVAVVLGLWSLIKTSAVSSTAVVGSCGPSDGSGRN